MDLPLFANVWVELGICYNRITKIISLVIKIIIIMLLTDATSHNLITIIISQCVGGGSKKLPEKTRVYVFDVLNTCLSRMPSKL